MWFSIRIKNYIQIIDGYWLEFFFAVFVLINEPIIMVLLEVKDKSY